MLAGRHSVKIPKPNDFHRFAKARDASSWPDRRRGLSNFLTWSFFLAEIVAADLFFGKGAHAAEAPDDPSKANSADHHPASDNPSAMDWNGKPDDVAPEDPNRLFHSTATPLDPHYAESAAMPALTGISGRDGGVAHAGGGGGGSPSFSQDPSAHASEPGLQALHEGGVPVDAETHGDSNMLAGLDAGVAATLGLELNPLQFDAAFGTDLLSSNPLSDALDLKALGLDVTIETGLLSGLLGGSGADGHSLLDTTLGLPESHVVEDVTGLNLSGAVAGLRSLIGSASDVGEDSHGLLSNVTSSVAGIMPDAAHPLSLATIGDVTGGDSLVFAASSIEHGVTDTLFSGGRYTDYNLALQSGTDHGASQADIGVGTPEPGESQASFDDHGLSVHADSAGHAVDVALTDLAGADHELLRGLSI